MGKCARCGKKKHYDWYKEWGKTIRPKSNTTLGPVLGVLPLGLPFAEVAVSTEWSNWPSLPDLFPKSFPGVKTSRDSFVVDIDFGSGDAVMPGQGRAAARPYTSHECETLAHAANALGNATYGHPPEPQHPLAQHPRQRVELQTRRLPDPENSASCLCNSSLAAVN